MKKLTKRQQEILAKRNLNTEDDFVRFFPRTYKDYSEVRKTLKEEDVGTTGCYVGVVAKPKKGYASTGTGYISFKLVLENSKWVRVTIFGVGAKYDWLLDDSEEINLAVTGELEYSENFGYAIGKIDDVKTAYHVAELAKVKPIYKKISGISEKTMLTLVSDSLLNFKPRFVISDALQKKYDIENLMPIRDAFYQIHHPNSMNMDAAEKSVDVYELLSFAKEIENKNSHASDKSVMQIKKTAVINDLVKSLPYKLTTDQSRICAEMSKKLISGKRVNALVQGDVGCGKTLVAVIMLFLAAENGYQSCIMAPTSILAGQHFEEIKGYAVKYGISVEYLDGTVKASEKKRILKGVSDGSVKILVGTHTVSSDIPFNNLGLVIIDEEHRFGVEQRDGLLNKASDGVSTISMSATPIPRTLATTMFGESMDIYDIHTMPSNRKTVKTAINASDNVIWNFIEKQLDEGRQAYVVCPLIEQDEDSESDVMIDVLSATDCYEMYKKRFEPKYKVALLNGKMKNEEITDVIGAFKRGEYQILISTTVIEVGVNVPNASVMIISNAERFGLAGMHQLRGRVGRGEYDGYCILKSTDKENERLKTMVECSDGFEIAKRDLLLRGAGDIIGIEQHGFSKPIELIMQNPELYANMQKLAKEL